MERIEYNVKENSGEVKTVLPYYVKFRQNIVFCRFPFPSNTKKDSCQYPEFNTLTFSL